MKDMHTPTDSESGLALYSIGKVAKMTGVNPITLRAWERRYKIVTPKRTDKGHRLYSEADIEQIKTITKMIDQGIQISRIKTLLESDTDLLLDVIPTEHRQDHPHWLSHKATIFEAIKSHNMPRLARIHKQLLTVYTPLEVGTMVSRTILDDFKKDAENSPLSAAYFHVYHAFLCQFLSRHLMSFPPAIDGDDTRILVIDKATKPSRLLMLWYSVLLRAEGYLPLLIDSNPPFEAIPELVATFNPTAIVIYDCQEVPLELVDDVNLPIFIASANQPDLELNSSKIKSLPYELPENIQRLKEYI